MTAIPPLRFGLALALLAPAASATAQSKSPPAAQVNRDVVASVPDDELVFGAPRTGVTLKINDDGVVGTLVQLGRGNGVLRGRFKNEPAEIRWTDDRVTGQIGGGAPLNLKLRRTEEGLKVDGLFRGVTSHFRIGYGNLEGRIGGCRYLLSAEKDTYTGERTCDFGVTEAVSLRIPRKLARRSQGELIATLAAVFLGQRE
jgi:hypothetical protein